MIETYFQIRSYLEGTYTLRIIDNFFELLLSIAPFLLISLAINIIVIQFLKGKKINFSSKNHVISVISGALIGLVSPLPTYAAIPIGISLMSAGVPFSTIMAFILASPLMNPSVFFLTATQLGLEMAVVRAFTAFSIAITGGFITMKILKSIYTQNLNVKPYKFNNQSVGKEIYRNSIYILKTFSIAILLSAAVKSLIPQSFIVSMLGGNTASGTLIAIGMGIPFYTCGGAAIPFMDTLQELGMNKGAVLAFFIAGPATKLETLYAYKASLGSKVLLFYLVLTLLFSFLSGLIYSAL